MQDRIDKYILGRMTAGESEAFERDLESDATLREQYEHTRIVKEEIGAQADLRKRMKEWDNPIPVIRRATLYWISGIAAILIIGFFAVPVFFHGDGDLLSDEPVLRGGGDDLVEIEVLIEQGEYDEALMKIDAAERELQALTDSFAAFPVDATDSELVEQREYELSEIALRQGEIDQLRAIISEHQD